MRLNSLIKSDYREEIDVMEEVKIDPQGLIQLDKYHTWQYGKISHLLLVGNGRKVKSFLWIIHKLLAETEEENLYICDGVDELYELCRIIWNLSNVESDAMAIGETVRKIENYGVDNINRERTGIFLVIDEFAALRIALDKKEFAEINDSLQRIIPMGRAANIHILSWHVY